MALYDEGLARWPVPSQAQHVPTRHGETFVIACGDRNAPPLVLLHGSGTNSAIWTEDAAVYSRHYRVYAVDMPGDPGKSAPNRLPWDSPALAEWLEDVLTALQIERVSLLGESLGGWTAVKYSIRCPERVDRLVLLCPGGILPPKKSFLPRAIGLSLLGQWGLRRLMRQMFADQAVPDGAEDILITVAHHVRPRIETLPLFSDDDLRRLTMPVLLLGGSKDIAFDMNVIAARLRPLLPCLEVRIIPGAGHALLHTSGPILAFLDSPRY